VRTLSRSCAAGTKKRATVWAFVCTVFFCVAFAAEPTAAQSSPFIPAGGATRASSHPCETRDDGSFQCHGVDGHALTTSSSGEGFEFGDVVIRTSWGTFIAEQLYVDSHGLHLRRGDVLGVAFAQVELYADDTGESRCVRDGAPCPLALSQGSGFTEASVVARPDAVSARLESLVVVHESALVLAAEGGGSGFGGTIALQPRLGAQPVRLDAMWDGDRFRWLASGQTLMGGGAGPWLRLDLDRGAAGGRSLFSGDGLDAGRQTSSLTLGAGDERLFVSVTARDLAGTKELGSRQALEADAALRTVAGPLSASFRTAGEFSVDGERRPAVGVATEASGDATLGTRGVVWIPGGRLSLTNWSTAGQTSEAPAVAQQLDVALDMELAARHRGLSARAWGQVVGSPIIRDGRRELQFIGPWRVDEGVFSSSYELGYTLRRPWGVTRWQATARWSDRVDGALAAEFLATGALLHAGARSVWRDDDVTPARLSAWAGAQSDVVGVRISAIGESGVRSMRPPSFGRMPLRRLDDSAASGLGLAQEAWVQFRDVQVEARVIARSMRADDVTGWGGVAWHGASSMWGLRADIGRQPSGIAGAVALSLGRSPLFGPFAGRWNAFDL
jgi:hypothetical protein